MRKIAVVIPKFGLTGGAEQFAARLSDRLYMDHDYHFSVFANRWADVHSAFSVTRVPIIAFPKYLTTLSFAWFARRRICGGSFDLVHSHERIFAADLFTLHGIPHRHWVRHVRQKP